MPVIINGTTGISGVDGSAGTPSYQGGDTNTGIFYPAADTIAFAEGGAEIARFDSSGNLGIGTSSPSFKLDVSAVKNTTNIKLTSTGLTTADDYTQLSFGDASNIYGAIRLGYNNPAANSASYLAFYNNTGGSTTERMRITSGGNVGIATSNPQSGLEIYRANSTTGSLTDASLMLSTTATTGRKVNIGFGLGGGVANTCAAVIGYDVTNGAGAGLGDIFFSTRSTTADSTPTERMRITSAGVLLVGRTTSTNQASVEVAGAIRVNNNTDKSADTTGTFGMFFAKGSTTVTGGGGATVIKNATGSEAAFYLVTGFAAVGSKRFYDVVVTMGAGLCTVLNSGGVNTPDTRTYTSTGENLQLSLSGSTSYAVRVTGFGANEAS